MSELFYGEWVIEVWQKEADFSERFVIEGSDSSDGAYPGITGVTPLVVTGPRWSIRLEWNDNAGSGWQASAVRRNSAAATIAEGVLVFLGADDNYEQLRDHDYNDVVLRCRSVDPDLTPWYPVARPYDFTLPEKLREEARRRNYCEKKRERCEERKEHHGRCSGEQKETTDEERREERREQEERERRKQG